MAYRTPGVYVDEVSLLPPSVAEVETALPAFIGYTARAERDGADLTDVPTRIGSMLEYVNIFGGAPTPRLDAITLNTDAAVTDVTFADGDLYYTFLAVRHFFDNGGGDCYIVSVGRFTGSDPAAAAVPVEEGRMRAGVDALETVDEPTILLAPDAALLSDDGFYNIQQAMLAQCARLGDRVAVFDLKENTATNHAQAVADFRDRIGVNGLKYGAAYTPWLVTSYPTNVDFSLIEDGVGGVGTLTALSPDPALNLLVTRASTAVADRDALVARLDTLRDTSPSIRDRYAGMYRALTQGIAQGTGVNGVYKPMLAFVRDLTTELAAFRATDVASAELRAAIDSYRTSLLGTAVDDLIAYEKNDSVQIASLTDITNDPDIDTEYADAEAAGFTSGPVSGIVASTADYFSAAAQANFPSGVHGNVVRTGSALPDLNAIVMGPDGPVASGLLAFAEAVIEAVHSQAEIAQQTLFGGHPTLANIRRAVGRAFTTLPPSAAVAGVYATVDRTRGVHKAPANVSLAYVSSPTVVLDDAAQEGLNVDSVGGKSINAIRSFSGRGTLVWGARTLAGNDNEWRYVPVRRLFNTVEESVKKSTAWAVFEPNDANLWVKVQGMIDNYLTQKWQEGALAGAVPSDAFYTAVGLGRTMTPQDVLEGRLIVEIGLAAVRPAEFIILRFSHVLQQS